MPTSNEIDQIEFVSAELTTHHDQKVLFSSCYRPPNSGSDWVDMFNIFLDQVSDQFDKVVISGDFNTPHIPWNTSASNSFIETLNDHFLTQISIIPTRNEEFLEAVSKYIPCIKLRERKDLPSINGTILNLIKKKSTVRKKLRSSPTSHLLEKFKHLRSKVKRMLRKSREEFYVSLGNNYQKSPKRFWSGMKRHTKTRSIPNIISMAEVNNDQKSQTARIKAKSPEDIASLFNRYFASVFESDDAVNDTSYESKALVLSEIILTVEEVQAVLETL